MDPGSKRHDITNKANSVITRTLFEIIVFSDTGTVRIRIFIISRFLFFLFLLVSLIVIVGIINNSR